MDLSNIIINKKRFKVLDLAATDWKYQVKDSHMLKNQLEISSDSLKISFSTSFVPFFIKKIENTSIIMSNGVFMHQESKSRDLTYTKSGFVLTDDALVAIEIESKTLFLKPKDFIQGERYRSVSGEVFTYMGRMSFAKISFKKSEKEMNVREDISKSESHYFISSNDTNKLQKYRTSMKLIDFVGHVSDKELNNMLFNISFHGNKQFSSTRSLLFFGAFKRGRPITFVENPATSELPDTYGFGSSDSRVLLLNNEYYLGTCNFNSDYGIQDSDKTLWLHEFKNVKVDEHKQSGQINTFFKVKGGLKELEALFNNKSVIPNNLIDFLNPAYISKEDAKRGILGRML